MIVIAEAVGEKSPNKPVDVVKIQALINNNDVYTGLFSPLAVDGVSSDALVKAIKTFQQNHPAIKAAKPDGKVSPGGRTLKRLNEYNNRQSVCRDYFPPGFGASHFGRFNIDRFIDLYKLQYPKPSIGAAGGLGLHGLVDRLIDDQNITDIRWAAYMLATVKHECANTWRPIEEYGKGAGHDYGKPVTVKIDEKHTVSNTYYGRGYVQLTWKSNYEVMDKALGLSGENSLLLHPAKALEADVAYRIMSHGMRNGSFTGKKLDDYISGGVTDYHKARRIINGLDQATLIKGYAENLEFLLRFCNSAC